MKEAKFRVFDLINNKMHYDNFCLRLESGNYILSSKDRGDSNEFAAMNSENAVAMLYTGLKDLNDVEIWDHDIVRTRNNRDAKVIYDEGSFLLDFIGVEGPYDYLSYGFEMGIYVVGNIHENPDLLKKEIVK